MNDEQSTPRPYSEWRTHEAARAEDAASTFGFHLLFHCREQALAQAEEHMTTPELREAIEAAVDTALHNLCDLLEGYWPTMAGPSNPVSYSLVVNVLDEFASPVERIAISPAALDLPVGYWKWRDGEFR